MTFDWLKILHLKPRYFFAVFLFGMLVLFLPTFVATKFGILALRTGYPPWIGGGTLAAFVLWAVHIVPWISNNLASAKYQTEVLQNLSGLPKQERFLLGFCIHRGQRTIFLQPSNSVAQSLCTKGLLRRSTGIGNVLSWPFTIPP